MSPLKFLRLLAKALAAEDGPSQLAGGFALGALAGLIPKTSLLAHAVWILLACLRVNMAAAAAAMALFTVLSPALDVLAHPLGGFLLSRPALAPVWTAFYGLPVVPWTGFNNTVTLGSFILGVLMVFPLYKAGIPVFARYQRTYGSRIRRWGVVRWLLGAQVAEKLG